jgi:hypothetical protein
MRIWPYHSFLFSSCRLFENRKFLPETAPLLRSKEQDEAMRQIDGSTRGRNMKTKALGIFLFFLGFHVLIGSFIPPQSTGDAAYYAIIAQSLASGSGFVEPFIWHHLREFDAMLHPTDYWQPLCSLLIYLTTLLPGAFSFTFFNHLLWAMLSAFVFWTTLEKTENPWAALLAAGIFGFGSKYSFYLSTTDNVGIYAVFGFGLFFLLQRPCGGVSSGLIGIISGLMALSRIDGIIFFGCSLGLILFRTKNLKFAALAAAGFLLVFSPWAIRNQLVFGAPLSSNNKPLFFQAANDLHEYGQTINWQSFSEKGFPWILRQKRDGLAFNIIEFFLVPTNGLFLPLLLIGFGKAWRQRERTVLLFALIMISLNGILFTEPSKNGTAIHMVPAFFAWFAVSCGIGLDSLHKHAKTIFFGRLLPVSVLLMCLFSFFFTATALRIAMNTYRTYNSPFEELVRKRMIPPETPLASTDPIRMYFLNKNPGVIISSWNATHVAGKFRCSHILLDRRIRFREDSLSPKFFSGWHLVASEGPLLVYSKKTE